MYTKKTKCMNVMIFTFFFFTSKKFFFKFANFNFSFFGKLWPVKGRLLGIGTLCTFAQEGHNESKKLQEAQVAPIGTIGFMEKLICSLALGPTSLDPLKFPLLHWA